MDYTKLVSRAVEIVRKNQFLWWLGILAAFTEGGMGGQLYSHNGMFDNMHHEVTRAAAGYGNDTMGQAFQSWVGTYPGFAGLLLVLSIILFICLLTISYTAQAGLILSTDALESNKHQGHTFRNAYRSGRPFAWQLFGYNLVLALTILLVIGTPLLIAVLAFFAITSNGVTGVDVGFGFLALLVFLVLLFIVVIGVTMMKKIGARIIVLKNKTITETMEQSWQLIHHQFINILLAWLVNLIVNFVVWFIVFIPAIVVALLLLAIGAAISAISLITAGLYSVVGLAAFATALIVVSGIATAWQSVYWTLTYQAVDYLAHHKDKK